MGIAIAILLLSPFVLLLASLALNGWRLYVIYRDSINRQARDVSDRHPPVPPRLADRVAELKGLGFRRLGELEALLPAVGLIRALTHRRDRTTAWLFVDADEATEAAVVERLVEFSSRLGDGSYVETMYPIGESIDQSELFVSRVKSSITDAYRRHRAVIDARTTEHGPPRPIRSMTDQEEHDRTYRIHHARNVLRRPLIYRGLFPLAVTGMFGFVLAWSSLPAILTIAQVLSR